MFGFGKKATVKGLHIAILTTDGVEHLELTVPWRALRKAGANVYVIGHKTGTIQTIRKLMRADVVPIDASVDEVSPDAFAGLLLPGTTLTVKQLKGQDATLEFVRAFMQRRKPIAAITAGPELLAFAGDLHGHTVTSSLAARSELQKAGAVWVDRGVVEDGYLLTARGPNDLKAFTKKLVGHFGR